MVRSWPPHHSNPGKFNLGRGPRNSFGSSGGGSNPVVESGSDITAPTLTNFAATPGADDRWGEMTVDTDEGNGTIYWIVQAAATATPSAAQVIAGQDGAGAAATFAGSSAVSATGTYTKRATGLSGGTAYEACVVHQDAAENNSDVGSSLFSTDTLVASRATNGLTTNMGIGSSSGTFTESQADADGGTNAVTITDINDSTTAQVTAQCTGITYFQGVNRFRLKVKNNGKAAAAMWLRINPASTTITSSGHFDITNGAVGTETWAGTPTITTLGNDWWQIDGSLDMTGADVSGSFDIRMGDADNDATVLRNGTNINAYYDIRITRTT
jgi:hypothetical protein